MNAWQRKGATAARSGRYRDMYSAWKAAKGKPKLTARDKKLGVTFNGKMVDAQEYFYEGFLSVPASNPSHRKTKKKLRKKTGFRGKMTGYKKAMGQMLATRRSRKQHVAVANPTAILFKSKAAAKKYVTDHGIKGYRITKVRKAK